MMACPCHARRRSWPLVAWPAVRLILLLGASCPLHGGGELRCTDPRAVNYWPPPAATASQPEAGSCGGSDASSGDSRAPTPSDSTCRSDTGLLCAYDSWSVNQRCCPAGATGSDAATAGGGPGALGCGTNLNAAAAAKPHTALEV
eukprot:SAG22_NODE_7480_length_735_cov_1.812893_1_plen_144_part_10